ncbi:hypothetical protein [Trueperella pecoris]|nr:hypothetical protein [Trueperella pecoris]QTG75642.1 hypothetical protein J4179_00745 [Trueperella pecoris]
MPTALTGAEDTPELLTRHSVLSYPLLREAPVNPVQVKRVSGIDRLGNLSARSVSISLAAFRISSFLTTPEGQDPTLSPLDRLSGPLTETLATDLRTLITTRQHLTVGLVPVSHVAALQQFFGVNTAIGAGVKPGEFLVHELSEHFLPEELSVVREGRLPSQVEERYLGELSEPHVIVGLSPSAWLRSWATGTPEQRDFVAMAFTGADSSKISSHNYRSLREMGAPVLPSSRAYRSLFSPKFWAYVVVFVYSSLRALPVTFVHSFHGSVALLWAMDIVTAIPYTWGLVAFITAHRTWVRFTGLVVTIVTFIAPYFYFWTHGQGYSWKVNAVVLLMIAGAVVYEGINYLRDHAVADGLRHSQM